MNERVKSVLKQLEAATESLDAFANDLWQGINFRDRMAREQGMHALDAYTEKVDAYKSAVDDVIGILAGIEEVALRTDTPETPANTAGNAVTQLDHVTAHSLTEHFTHKIPIGFKLGERAVAGMDNWSDWYAAVCKELARRDPTQFATLPANPAFVTSYGNKRFSRNEAELRRTKLIADGIYAEVGVDANSRRDLVKKLLPEFGLAPANLKVYFRQ